MELDLERHYVRDEGSALLIRAIDLYKDLDASIPVKSCNDLGVSVLRGCGHGHSYVDCLPGPRRRN